MKWNVWLLCIISTGAIYGQLTPPNKKTCTLSNPLISLGCAWLGYPDACKLTVPVSCHALAKASGYYYWNSWFKKLPSKW
jgi:hypothetical protein